MTWFIYRVTFVCNLIDAALEFTYGLFLWTFHEMDLSRIGMIRTGKHKQGSLHGLYIRICTTRITSIGLLKQLRNGTLIFYPNDQHAKFLAYSV